jgi:hypothetical protein
MAIEIKRIGSDQFIAKISPPHADSHWQNLEPMSRDDLVKKLVSLGAHPVDIGDVLYEIDPALIGIKPAQNP